MDEILKRKLVYASAFSLAAMLIIVSFFSVSLKHVTVDQANKLSNLTHSYYIQSTNLTGNFINDSIKNVFYSGIKRQRLHVFGKVQQ